MTMNIVLRCHGGTIAGVIIGNFKASFRCWIVRATLSILAMACGGGCSWIPDALGMHNGHLLQPQDALALPGEKVALRVRLESGSFLRDEKDRSILLALDGRPYATVVTDREGFAETSFVPPSSGDYRFEIEVIDPANGDAWPTASLLVSCRPAEARLLVIDLDGTLMEADFEKVLTGDPEPLPYAPEVLRLLSHDYTVLYLTHRPEFFGPKSKSWLIQHGFPIGPVLLSELSSFARGSRRYKTHRLHDIRSRFGSRSFGIGDQISDTRAYRENGLGAILIHHADPNDAGELRKQAEKLGKLSEDIHVVHDWSEVRAILQEGKSFPPGRMKEELLQHAAQLKPQWKLW